MEFVVRLILKTKLSESMIKNDIKYLIQDYLHDNGIRVSRTEVGLHVIINAEEK